MCNYGAISVTPQQAPESGQVKTSIEVITGS